MVSTDLLKEKEVINIKDGRFLGYIGDIDINLEKGRIEAVIIPESKGMFSIFSGKQQEKVIKWEHVKTIGDDVVLVDID